MLVVGAVVIYQLRSGGSVEYYAEKLATAVFLDATVVRMIIVPAAMSLFGDSAWYLPKWDDDTTDLDHLMAAHNFDVLGYRFDGVAVDIEWNQDGLEVAE